MSGTKPCLRPGCPDLTVRHAGEPASRWRARYYCSRRCGVAHANHLRGERLEAGRQACPKTCEGCGKSYVRAPTESAAKFAERVFCSNRCKHLHPRQLVSTYPPRPCGWDGCSVVFQPAARNPHQKYCGDYCGREAKRAYDRKRKAALAPGTPPVERTCAWLGCGRTFAQPRQTRMKLYCCRPCADRAKRANAPTVRRFAQPPKERFARLREPTSPGWSGSPREAMDPAGSGMLERAIRVLRRRAPVYPESVVRPGSDLWMYGHLRLTEDELIARAESYAPRRAEGAAA